MADTFLTQASVILFRASWSVFFLLAFFGARTRYAAISMLFLSFVAWAIDGDRKTFFDRALTFGKSSSERALHSAWLLVVLNGLYFLMVLAGVPTERALLGILPAGAIGWTVFRRLGYKPQDSLTPAIQRLATFLIALTVVYFLLSNILHFDGMDAGYIDWGIYIQGTANLAAGRPAYVTGWDWIADARTMHFSVSIPFLAWIYRYISSPFLLVLWQSVFLIAPAFVFLAWIRRDLSKRLGQTDPILELLCFSAFVFGPIVSGNFQWPYVWHVIGPFFFALAFYFYDQRRFLPCFVSLVLFALQKQEFGIFVASFGGFAVIDFALADKKKRIPFGFALILFGGLYYYFASKGRVLAFSDRFGNLGANPKEALMNLFLDPARYWRAWSSWPSVRFALFFLFCSFAFWKPRWRSLRFLVPVLPLIFLFSGEDVMRMRELRNHYVLPLNIALFSTLVFGLLPRLISEARFLYRGRALFLALLAVSAFWGQNTPFHELQRTGRIWWQNAGDRRWVENLRGLREEAICCEGRLCTLLADRATIVFSEHCLNGSRVLSAVQPKRVGLLMYKHSAEPPPVPRDEPGRNWYVPLPDRWEYESDFMRFAWVETKLK